MSDPLPIQLFFCPFCLRLIPPHAIGSPQVVDNADGQLVHAVCLLARQLAVASDNPFLAGGPRAGLPVDPDDTTTPGGALELALPPPAATAAGQPGSVLEAGDDAVVMDFQDYQRVVTEPITAMYQRKATPARSARALLTPSGSRAAIGARPTPARGSGVTPAIQLAAATAPLAPAGTAGTVGPVGSVGPRLSQPSTRQRTPPTRQRYLTVEGKRRHNDAIIQTTVGGVIVLLAAGLVLVGWLLIAPARQAGPTDNLPQQGPQ